MGMFDSFHLPCFGMEREAQTKNFDCTMDNWRWGDAFPHAQQDVFFFTTVDLAARRGYGGQERHCAIFAVEGHVADLAFSPTRLGAKRLAHALARIWSAPGMRSKGLSRLLKLKERMDQFERRLPSQISHTLSDYEARNEPVGSKKTLASIFRGRSGHDFAKTSLEEALREDLDKNWKERAAHGAAPELSEAFHQALEEARLGQLQKSAPAAASPASASFTDDELLSAALFAHTAPSAFAEASPVSLPDTDELFASRLFGPERLLHFIQFSQPFPDTISDGENPGRPFLGALFDAYGYPIEALELIALERPGLLCAPDCLDFLGIEPYSRLIPLIAKTLLREKPELDEQTLGAETLLKSFGAGAMFCACENESPEAIALLRKHFRLDHNDILPGGQTALEILMPKAQSQHINSFYGEKPRLSQIDECLIHFARHAPLTELPLFENPASPPYTSALRQLKSLQETHALSGALGAAPAGDLNPNPRV